MKVYSHHLRGTLVPAEDIQREPVSVIRSIPLRKLGAAFIIATTLAFVVGGALAIGGNS